MRDVRAAAPLPSLALALLAACGGASEAPSPDKAISAYALVVGGRSIPGRIDEASRRVTLVVPGGTTVTSLVAHFSASGASVKVGGVVQASGATANDFTGPVTYTVTAQDGTSVEYLVTVTRSPGGVGLASTGQILSFDPSATPRDDGALRRGLTWPVPRMVLGTSAEADCVLDAMTGLMWMGTASTATNWADAFTFVAERNAASLCGHTDWRLPNLNELATLIDASSQVGLLPGAPPCAATSAWWSSTTYAGSTGSAYTVKFPGDVLVNSKTGSACVVPVRGTTSYAAVPKTGQTTSFAAGDDGALELGAAWPAPRFAIAAGAVTDANTGLTWARDANLVATRDASFDQDGTAGDGLVTWQHALDYVAKLNAEAYLGYSDWRLPNTSEGRSLFNASQAVQQTWLMAAGQGFTGVVGAYWTSTTAAGLPDWAYYFSSTEAQVNYLRKTSVSHVWPVRGGP